MLFKYTADKVATVYKYSGCAVTGVVPMLDVDKLFSDGMTKGIPASLMTQVHKRDGINGLADLVETWNGRNTSHDKYRDEFGSNVDRRRDDVQGDTQAS